MEQQRAWRKILSWGVWKWKVYALKDIINYNLGNQRIAGNTKTTSTSLYENKQIWRIPRLTISLREFLLRPRCASAFLIPFCKAQNLTSMAITSANGYLGCTRLMQKIFMRRWENATKVKGHHEQPIIERDKERILREYKLSKEKIRTWWKTNVTFQYPWHVRTSW